MPTTSTYCCKLIPIFTSLHTLLTVTVVLRKFFTVASRFSKITRRWRACWSKSVYLTFVSIRSCNVFVCLPSPPRGKGTWVNFSWVCAAGLSEPPPHYSLFCGRLLSPVLVTLRQICNFRDPNLFMYLPYIGWRTLYFSPTVQTFWYVC